ncbi:Antifungal protein [Penicillium brasilianum]|uniref:Antifungal protein n=1 Tax=Penicillium brasilianum TaxID=104259 RepID=A0A1S9RCZ7_PENBI|nr:Antifungal protein [Penicillium brasilianum]
MQIAKISLLLFAAMGTVASPIDAESEGLSVRGVNAADIQYTGKCYTNGNNCKYDFDGKTHFVKCPSAANTKCEKNGNKCTYDSYNGKVKCDFRH